jgi:hypothetical protein
MAYYWICSCFSLDFEFYGSFFGFFEFLVGSFATVSGDRADEGNAGS